MARTLVAVVDDTEESRLAVDYAALRAAREGGQVLLVHVMPPPDFVQWGAVAEAMEAEAREAGEQVLGAVADRVAVLTGARPATQLRVGKAGEQVLDALTNVQGVGALVLATAERGGAGPLVSFFTGERLGHLPCPLILIPGRLAPRDIAELA
jgi:nucleotide-binding universal stress UspA family protein